MSPIVPNTGDHSTADNVTVNQTATQSSSKKTTFKSYKSTRSSGKPMTYTASPPTSGISQDCSSEYGGKSFDQFSIAVQMLCHLLWPTSTPSLEKPSARRKRRRFDKALRKRQSNLPKDMYKPKQFLISQMRGGGYNSVVGITIMGQGDEVEAAMVLRVPKLGVLPSDHGVTNLQFVQEYLSLPTAELLAYDPTKSNPLGSPYMLQRRIHGYDLESSAQSYPSLTHKQKLAFVEEFCENILLGLQFVQFPWIGQINRAKDGGFTVSPFEAYHESKKLVAKRAEALPFFKERPLGKEELANPQAHEDRLEIQSVLHFFEVQFGRYRNRELCGNAGIDPAQHWEETIWHRLVKTARQMNEYGCLRSEFYCLTHYDLDPRNIMVEIQEDKNPKISAIIDWDLACFAPDWVGCKPPMWIWNWLDGGSEDERKANDEEGLTDEQKELKQLFDDSVGADYRYNAYQPHYRLARELFRFARYGCPSKELVEEAEKVCDEWDVLYKEKEAAWEARQREVEDDDEDAASEHGEVVEFADEDAASVYDDDDEASVNITDAE